MQTARPPQDSRPWPRAQERGRTSVSLPGPLQIRPCCLHGWGCFGYERCPPEGTLAQGTWEGTSQPQSPSLLGPGTTTPRWNFIPADGSQARISSENLWKGANHFGSHRATVHDIRGARAETRPWGVPEKTLFSREQSVCTSEKFKMTRQMNPKLSSLGQPPVL